MNLIYRRRTTNHQFGISMLEIRIIIIIITIVVVVVVMVVSHPIRTI